MEYGFLSVIPVIVLLAVAIITKKTISSIFMGMLAACIIIGGKDFISVLINRLYETGTDEGTIWISIILALIGVIIALLEISGGSTALVETLRTKVRSEKSLFLWSWLVVAALFIEDMTRSAVLGQLSPMYDKFKIPRAALAYMAGTSAPTIAALVPITAWAAFFMGVFGDFEELKYLGSGYDIYVKSIPFQFYPILAIIVCFLFTMGVIPKLGGMKKVYERAAATGELYGEESKRLNMSAATTENKEYVEEKSVKLRLTCFIISIGILVISIVKTGDIVWSFFFTIISMVIINLITRLSTWKQMMAASLNGIVKVVDMIVICFVVYCFRDITTEMGLAAYVIELSKSLVTPEILPALTFIACCLLTFTTGSTWGITVVYAAIAVPLSMSINANPVLVIAAILSGECFGAHICFYCDYTVYNSAATKINNLEHALTQLPYGLIAGGIATVGYLITGFAM